MERGRWKAGDLVQTESMQKTGRGDECHSHLVLVLGIYSSKYPLRKEDTIYEVIRDDGKYLKLGLKDYAWPGARLTNCLVQRSGAEEET